MNVIKTLIFAMGLFLLTTTAAIAQTESTKSNGESSKFVYCEMVGTKKF